LPATSKKYAAWLSPVTVQSTGTAKTRVAKRASPLEACSREAVSDGVAEEEAVKVGGGARGRGPAIRGADEARLRIELLELRP